MTEAPIYPVYFYDHAVQHFDRFLINGEADLERILQIGVMTGDVTLWMAEHFPNATLVDVDPWTKDVYDDHYESWDIDPALRMDYEGFFRYYSQRTAHIGDRLHTYREPSESFFYNYDGSPFDFIYIDGDHSEAGALLDLEGALRFSHPGTIIAVDDYNFPEVKAATDKFVARGAVDVSEPIIATHEPEVLDPSTTKTLTVQAEQWQQWLVVT